MHRPTVDEDSRCFPRVPTGEAIRIQFDGDKALVAGVLVNLSVGGAFVRCVNPGEIGRPMKCAFFVAQAGVPRLVSCKARVVWVSGEDLLQSVGPGFGLSFTDYQQDALGVLQTFTHYDDDMPRT